MLLQTQRLTMLECPKGPVDVVLDTDAYNEIDDQFAIAYALGADEKLSIKAIYAAPFFNERSKNAKDGMEKSYHEICKLLALADKQVPVFKGSENFMANEQEAALSTAAQDLCERAMTYTSEKPLYVAAMGAITNVASALLINPQIADRIVVIWLGGNALEWPENGEFNMRQDIAAARVVFNSGVPLVLLPCLGVVHNFTSTGPELDFWLRGRNPLCDYLVKQTVDEANKYAKGRVWSRVIWDVTTIGWLLNDDNRLMLEKLIPTPIPEYDNHYTQDSRRVLCKYVYFIRRDSLMADLFEHLTKPVQAQVAGPKADE